MRAPSPTDIAAGEVILAVDRQANLDALRIMEELNDQEGIASALGRISGGL